ncbi:MAG TPA: DUF2293 domain-containing protein [Streptosporangiaceae bacterium]|nr:DUF2293 domain-containing protein [Streptosporangiaceae bacterium]
MGSRSVKSRVAVAAAEALARQGFVTPVDVCLGLGWLHASNVDDWRHGRVDDLEYFLPVHGDRITEFIVCLDSWARERGLQRTEAEYVSATKSRRPLRFSTGAPAVVEATWRTRWVSPDLPARKRERITKIQDSPPDLVVVQPVREWTCAECRGTGDLLIMDDEGPLCLACADLDHLVFLPSGDAALTRRARKASGLSAVVVRWSRTRKRYERQGLLVEEAALEQAEQQCLADEDARMRRRERDRERRAAADVELQAAMIKGIKRLFPRCPAGRAEAIARHTSLRGSGRVGRSAAGRSLDNEALTLAVAASIRHQDTDYDSLLMSGVSRAEARDVIRPAVDRILASWSSAPSTTRR